MLNAQGSSRVARKPPVQTSIEWLSNKVIKRPFPSTVQSLTHLYRECRVLPCLRHLWS